jgi:Tfp pilus assembly protein PilX
MRPSQRQTLRRQRGYMLLLVVVFLLVLLSTLGLAYRQMVQTLRLEEARTRQIDLDQGSLQLAVLGLGMLENTMEQTTFEATQTYDTSSGPKTYKLNLERVSVEAGTGIETWRLTVGPP